MKKLKNLKEKIQKNSDVIMFWTLMGGVATLYAGLLALGVKNSRAARVQIQEAIARGEPIFTDKTGNFLVILTKP